MSSAVQAGLIVLLSLVALGIIVYVVRTRSKSRSAFELGVKTARDIPQGTDALGAGNVDSMVTVRRRFLGLAGAAGAFLSVLVIKLWSMQIISGKEYTASAEANRTTEYTTIAPRGRILDRHGEELVGNRATYAVLANADVQYDKTVIRRLSNVLGIPRQTVAAQAANQNLGAQADRVIAISKSFHIDAQVVGHIEEGPRSLTIRSEFGEFNY